MSSLTLPQGIKETQIWNVNAFGDKKRKKNKRKEKFCDDWSARGREIIILNVKRREEYLNNVMVKDGRQTASVEMEGEEGERCSNQEWAGEKKQSDRLGFSSAGGAILQCYQYLLTGTVTPRNRSYTGKTCMVRSLLNKVRKNLKYYRQGSFNHKIRKYTAINPPNHRTNGIIHSSHVL